MKNHRRFIIILIFLFILQPFIWSEGQSDRIPQNPKMINGTLENGMKYYIQQNDNPRDRAILRLAVNAGSLMEEDDQLGMAHFLEHMAFNGTEEYAENDLVRFLQSIGMQFGPDINAHTSFDETVYKLMIPLDQPDNLDTGLNILEQWAFHMNLNTDDVEEERGIIHEEWRRGLGASRRMMDTAYPQIMYKSLYGERLPIGTEESILNCTPESIRRFYKEWYRPDLMAIVAVGDFDPRQMEQDIITRFSEYKNPERPKERTEPEVPDHMETVFTNQSDPEATWTAAVIFNKIDNEESRLREDYRTELMEDLYLVLFNNRLEDLQNGPEPPFTYSYVDFSSMTRPKSFHTMTVVTADGALYDGFETILTEEKRIRDHGFTATELARAKKQLYSRIFTAYNNRNNRESVEIASEYINYFLNGTPAPGIEYLWDVFNEYIETISLEDIHKRTQLWLTESNRVIYTMSPSGDDREAVDPVKLSGINYKISQTATEALEERTVSTSLLEELPEPGTITERKKLEAAGAEEWTLSNGAKVVLKKTDFKENEILFSSMSPGGVSLAEDNDYLSASFASQIIQRSGIGAFSMLDLDRALAGSTAGLQPVISEMSSGTRGSSTREDLETLFQLNYLYFTSPRLDKESWSSYKSRMADSLRNRDSNPMTQYSDLLIKLLYKDHVRSRPLKEEVLDDIDDHKAFEFYKERYTQASNFTFFITGSYDEEQIIPLVEKYVASLPNNGSKENWVDRDLRYPKGEIRESISSGQDPVSYVTMIYPGEWEWSSRETQLIQAVADSLQMVITEEVRESASGTYSPSVSVTPARVPYEDYYFMISFSCDPERTEELTNLVKEVINNLKNGDIEDRIIKDVIKARSVILEEQLRKNSYWLSRMERNYFLKLPAEEIPPVNELEDYYSKELMQERMNRYFSDEDNIEVILYPAE
ncbi:MULTISPECIES: pitrilysin family protein [unclassified Oceanispirochaeta]|uniref:M16 family metallopeptidase n=1 Tax=unclassified Oceanispirochaeta TaxID=2635722 RepID=UPI000E094E0E|nr:MULTISPECIES: M16 family metallopeptidase [unclassified Oceanispirochaeta]MBF9015440.1 insulinase family protein [Oceanispirochaeta sp. M2]NPD71899.1 insulinase family protein [Oceanispirochaeta sp. M1]RDG32707.1 insulinase family protein [Oceanispirochaeta sp. M1]